MIKSRKIYIIGAFDRFNYGDMLLALIAKRIFELRAPSMRVIAYALSVSDYSRYGALSTRPLKDLYSRRVLNSGDVILFVGGGTIGSNYSDMLSNLMGAYGNSVLYFLERLCGIKFTDSLCRYYFRCTSPFPWIASSDDFSASVSVIYNSVGGSEMSHLSPQIQAAIMGRLAKSAYVSVRDIETKKLLKPLDSVLPVHVAPDSATLMSKLFPLSYLESVVSPNIKSIVEQNAYLCFHANSTYIKRNISDIVCQLNSLYHKHGLRILLLPIGRYFGLDDYVGLKEVYKRLINPSELIANNVSVWDIMYVIARAAVFVGTSLHGHITAQSFAIPHVGLSLRRNKVDFYLETWDIPEYSKCCAATEICLMVEKALNVPVSVRSKKQSMLIVHATANYDNIISVAHDGLETYVNGV